jgi:hypothetical protein
MARQPRRASRPRSDPTAYARLQRLRAKRRAEGRQLVEVWLSAADAALVTELQQPDEPLSALIGRALRALQGQGPAVPVSPVERRAALVARIRAMRAAEMTHRVIAAQFNAEGVPTLTGRGQWRAGTIINLLHEAAP